MTHSQVMIILVAGALLIALPFQRFEVTKLHHASSFPIALGLHLFPVDACAIALACPFQSTVATKSEPVAMD